MAKTGKPQEELPRHLVMTDLRVLIVRMMQVPADWKSIELVPMSSTVELLKGVASSQKARAEEEETSAKMSSIAEAPEAAPAAADDEPPPLIEA